MHAILLKHEAHYSKAIVGATARHLPLEQVLRRYETHMKNYLTHLARTDEPTTE